MAAERRYQDSVEASSRDHTEYTRRIAKNSLHTLHQYENVHIANNKDFKTAIDALHEVRSSSI